MEVQVASSMGNEGGTSSRQWPGEDLVMEDKRRRSLSPQNVVPSPALWGAPTAAPEVSSTEVHVHFACEVELRVGGARDMAKYVPKVRYPR